ncbi:MAG: hypothetical protein IKR76_07820, partial [Ruminococcus sp.]|nr:hypothetical protein [Ruminococcus sp.]
MTVKERLQELREQIANTPAKNDKKVLFIELLAYNNFAVTNGDDRDITSIKELDSFWKKPITKHGVFDKMYDDLTDEQIINHANDPKGFKSALEKAQDKFVKDSLKAEKDKFFNTHEKISDKEFERRTAKNGWALKQDSVIVGYLYKMAIQTNDEKLVAMYEKFLSTDARDPAVRKQMLTEVNEAFSTYDKTKYLVSLNSVVMRVFKNKVKEDPTREEIDKACKEYEAIEKKNKERSIKEAKKAAEEKAL